MDKKIKKNMLNALKDIVQYAKGIMVYGSFAKGYADKQSDIDICVIKKEGINLKNLYDKILQISSNKRYDIVIFDEIPWYLRGEILESGKVIYAQDDDELDFWLYKQLKIWEDMKKRQKLVSPDDLVNRLKT
ncbi:MAG: nucleotidyltransferase domain-containing protein [Candidatus Thermoplasmatota archaeon]|nr:nucleotidyltransferase domain-containing protein [Candidatus Thermoplasmatota archaeon]